LLFRELKRALEQPLTDYDQIPSKWPGNSNDYHRETKASILRQLPRHRSLSNNDSPVKRGKNHPLSSTLNDETTTPAAKQLRKDHREKTLEQLDMVLEKLNESTERITLRQQDSQVSSGGTNMEQNTSVKKSMENMRQFAKPQSVRGLVSMVHNIIEEFNS
jgi:hypothetical protein